MRRILIGLLAALVAAFLWTNIANSRTQSSISNFWIHCMFTGKSATQDPIVDPGNTATAHFHSFYGNTTVDQNSTPDSLRAAGSGATTCSTATDTAAYWAPTLVLGPGETQTYGPPGHPCTTDAISLTACSYSNIRAYYGLSGASRAQIVIPPSGEEAVGGDHLATGPQPVNHVAWSCGGTTPFEQYPYDCTGLINTTGNNDQDGINLRVIFPRCWDGTGAATTDFAYPLSGTGPNCPAGFGKVLPLINVRFHTGIVTPCPGQSCPAGSKVTPDFGFEMADGSMMPWYQAHGDFLNGWQYQPVEGGLDDLVQDCLIVAGSCPVNPRTTNNPT